jgi:O-antigen/teichoic acid export membrane protein
VALSVCRKISLSYERLLRREIHFTYISTKSSITIIPELHKSSMIPETKRIQSISRDLLFYVPSKLIPAILAVFLIIVLTRSLTPNEYGKYAVVLAIINLSSAFVTAWLRQSILRFYPEYQIGDRTSDFQQNAIPLLCGSAFIVCIVLSLVMSMLGYHSKQIVLACIVSFAQILFDYLTTLYQSARLSRNYAEVALVQSIIQLAIAFGLVYIIRGGYAFAVIAVGSGYAGAVFYIFIRRKKTNIHFNMTFKSFDWPLTKKMLGYGLPMAVWFFSFQMIFFINRLIISSRRSYDEAGVYSSVYDLMNGSLSLMMTPFLLAVHPIVMQMWAQSRDRTGIEELIARIFRYLLLLCVPIFTFCLIINYELFRIFLGPAFTISGWVVPLLVATVFFSQFSLYFHKGLEIAEKTRIMMNVAIGCACLNIGLNLIFTGQYGYTAAAIFNLITYLIYILISSRLSSRFIRTRLPWSSTLKIIIAAASAGMLLRIFKGPLVTILPNSSIWIMGSVFFFGCVYFFVLNVLGEISDEKKKLYALVRRRLFRSKSA